MIKITSKGSNNIADGAPLVYPPTVQDENEDCSWTFAYRRVASIMEATVSVKTKCTNDQVKINLPTGLSVDTENTWFCGEYLHPYCASGSVKFADTRPIYLDIAVNQDKLNELIISRQDTEPMKAGQEFELSLKLHISDWENNVWK